MGPLRSMLLTDIFPPKEIAYRKEFLSTYDEKS